MNSISNAGKKIDLLLISLEALNINNSLYNNKLKYTELLCNLLYLKYINANHIYFNQHYNTIILIYYLYGFIKQLPLEKGIINILKNYSKNNICIITLQYLRRYRYLYQKTQSYYLTISQYNTIDIKIKDDAIINLYTIYRIYKTNNLYLLIEYLYNY